MAAASTEHRLQHGGCLHVVGRCFVGCIAWRSCCSEEINAHFRSSHCMCSAGVGGCMWGAVLGGRCEQAECFWMAPDPGASWQRYYDSHCSILQHSSAVASIDAASSPAYIVVVHTAHAHAVQAANGQHAAAGIFPCASEVCQRRNHRTVGALGCMCASCFDP